MPILATGKDAGFTLIEVLAVIILIGLIFALVQPSLILGEERTEIIYIGKLITSDLKLIKEDSLVNKIEATVEFLKNGYQFSIGNNSITRKFKRFGFSFLMSDEKGTEPSQETETIREKKSPDHQHTPKKDSPTENDTNNANNQEAATDEDATNTDMDANKQSVDESVSVTFKEDGSVSKQEFNWESNHFKGKLAVDENGAVKWTYEKK